MAKRPVYLVNMDKEIPVIIYETDFIWESGFAKSQKQKSVKNLHESFLKQYPHQRVLEISTSSIEALGRNLSAFQLKVNSTVLNKSYSVESIFQSSKVFEKGGPFLDIKLMDAKDAKKDKRLKNSGKLIGFLYGSGNDWGLQPSTMFYDWVYMNVLKLHPELVSDLCNFTAFTDIEFNPKKSINCQAKAAALYVSLLKQGLLEDVLKSKESYIKYRKYQCRV